MKRWQGLVKEFKEYLDKNNNGLWYVPSYN